MRLEAGYPVLHFERIDSTNAEARRLAELGEHGPLWLVADVQDSGRGRRGRAWVSEPGNLYATLLFSISAGPDVAAQVGLVAAVAVHDAVRRLCPELAVRIKWPNDLLIGGAKFCGILSEVVGNRPTRIALGCGINIAGAPAGTPYPVTALGGRISVESVFQELDSSLSNRLRIWDEGQGFPVIREAWTVAALGIGGSVTASEEVSGIFTGIAADGALILVTAGQQVKHIHSGDVRFAELEELRQQ